MFNIDDTHPSLLHEGRINPYHEFLSDNVHNPEMSDELLQEIAHKAQYINYTTSLESLYSRNTSTCSVTSNLAITRVLLRPKSSERANKKAAVVRTRFEPKACYIPKNLDLESFYEAFTPPNIRVFTDKAYYILDLVTYLYLTQEEKRKKRDSEGTFINSKLLQSKIRDYKKVLEYLIANNVLETNGIYSKGEASRAYSFTDKYTTPLKKVDITDQRFLKAINTRQTTTNTKKYLDDELTDISKYPYLTHTYNRNLSFDYSSAHEEYVNSSFTEEEYELVKSGEFLSTGNSLFQDEDGLKQRKKRLTTFYATERDFKQLESNDFNLSIDSTAGRFHSVITRIPAFARKHLTYNGDQLITIDVVNCQPYLVSGILNPITFKSLDIMEKISIYNKMFNDGNLRKKLMNLIESVKDKPDVLKFIEQVSDGSFYEDFGNLLYSEGLTTIEDRFERRELTKSIIFPTIYGSNYMNGTSNVSLFKEIYPNVFKVFKLIKRGQTGERYHKALACTLQSLESNIILHQVCRNLYDLNPDIPLVTIHDSIMTTPDYVDVVQEEIKRVFEATIGFPPQLKVE